ncbi:hypothetical protein GYB22_05595 [bacterium]|nr:hypothetical protein [bacterium]
MDEYFTLAKSSGLHDSSEFNYTFLEAYHENDTSFLAEQLASLKYRANYGHKKDVIQIPSIYSYNFDEVYRFTYSAAFCNKSAILTIGKNAYKQIIDLYIYEQHRPFSPQDTFEGINIHHQKITIDSNVWKKLQEGIYHSDFWGLMQDNGEWGFDGSTLTVAGYNKYGTTPDQTKIIRRWAAEEMAIGKLFKQILDETGTVVECFRYK